MGWRGRSAWSIEGFVSYFAVQLFLRRMIKQQCVSPRWNVWSECFKSFFVIHHQTLKSVPCGMFLSKRCVSWYSRTLLRSSISILPDHCVRWHGWLCLGAKQVLCIYYSIVITIGRWWTTHTGRDSRFLLKIFRHPHFRCLCPLFWVNPKLRILPNLHSTTSYSCWL